MRWRIRVHAGETRRRHHLIEAPIPPEVIAALRSTGAVPTLFQSGRQRAIPCQIHQEADDPQAPPRLVWMLRSLGRGRTLDFTLTLGDRQRRAPARVRLRPTAAGWTVAVRKVPVADILSPQEGVRHLLLRGGLPQPIRLAFGPTRPIRRLRPEKPIIRSGPAMGQFFAHYLYLDQAGRPHWSETVQLTFPDTPRDCRIVDIKVTWRANLGPIVLDTRPPPSGPSQPTNAVLTAESSAEVLGHARGAPGVPLGLGEPPFPTHYLLADGERHHWALLAGPQSFGFPPDARQVSEGRLEFAPGLRPDQQHRLPVGSEIQFAYRLLEFADRAPQSYAAARCVDWYLPVAIEWLDEDSSRQ